MTRRKKSDFLKWREKHGVTKVQASEYFAVTARTVTNWDRNGAPALAMRLITLVGRRDLSGYHSAWKGWSISHTGKMHGPGGVWFRPRQLAMLPAYVDELQSRLCSIEAEERERLEVRRRLLREAVELEAICEPG